MLRAVAHLASSHRTVSKIFPPTLLIQHCGALAFACSCSTLILFVGVWCPSGGARAGRMPRRWTLPTSWRGAGWRFFEPSGRPGPGWFRCTRWRAGLRAEVPESPPDARGHELVRLCRLLPGPAEVGSQGAGEPQLGMGCDHQPRPPVGRLRAAKPGLGPPERLLEQAKRVLQVEAAKERLPAAVDVRGGDAGAGPPQPDRPVHPTAGQLLHDQPDDGALDDRQRPFVVDPGRPPGQPRVQPVPRLRGGLPVEAGVGYGHCLLGAPGGGLKTNSPPCLGGRPPLGS